MNASRRNPDLTVGDLLNFPTLPGLGPEMRSGLPGIEELNGKTRRALNELRVGDRSEKLARSLVLLWHDHLDASHSLSQEIEDADGSYLHGIMHRREPVYSNAKYWFRRVGPHEVYPDIGREVGRIAKGRDSGALVVNGIWDPMAMTDACAAALRTHESQEIAFLQRVQDVEFRVLLRRFLS